MEKHDFPIFLPAASTAAAAEPAAAAAFDACLGSFAGVVYEGFRRFFKVFQGPRRFPKVSERFFKVFEGF